MSRRKLPAAVKGDAQRILDRAARRLLSDQLERKKSADGNGSPRRHRKAA